MVCKSEISIFGYSSVAALTSLLLAEQGIQHTFHVRKNNVSFFDFPPISNPLVNNKTQQLEKKYIPLHYLDKIQYIKEYDFVWYDDNHNQTLQMKGDYQYPIYAIDNRIRFQCFWDHIIEHPLINVISFESHEEILQSIHAPINIIGGGDKFSSLFPDTEKYPRTDFPKKSDLLLFNLQIEEQLLQKYSNVKMLFLNNIGYAVVYPFLHSTGKNSLNLVVSFTKGGRADFFDKSMPITKAFSETLSLLSQFDNDLTKDLSGSTLLDTAHYLFKIEPYFKIPVIQKNQSTLFGIGDTIAKNDPVTGQGYNSGVDIATEFVKQIENYNCRLDKITLVNAYKEYTNEKLNILYHLNLAFTQNKYNSHIVYQEAANNLSLRNYIISAFEDISVYLPWLIDENAAQNLIKRHCR